VDTLGGGDVKSGGECALGQLLVADGNACNPGMWFSLRILDAWLRSTIIACYRYKYCGNLTHGLGFIYTIAERLFTTMSDGTNKSNADLQWLRLSHFQGALSAGWDSKPGVPQKHFSIGFMYCETLSNFTHDTTIHTHTHYNYCN
jgi:hypothetical protein